MQSIDRVGKSTQSPSGGREESRVWALNQNQSQTQAINDDDVVVVVCARRDPSLQLFEKAGAFGRKSA